MDKTLVNQILNKYVTLIQTLDTLNASDLSKGQKIKSINSVVRDHIHIMAELFEQELKK